MRKNWAVIFILPVLVLSSCLRLGIIANKTNPTELATITRFVPDDYPAIKEIEKLPPVTIRVHLYIESYVVMLENKDNSLNINIFNARSADEIDNDIRLAQDVFCRIGLKMEVQDVSYIEPYTHLVREIDDLKPYEDDIANKNNPEEMGIYYILGHGGIPSFSGCAGFPWDHSKAFFIMGRIADAHTVAHELGHHLGLFHTFEMNGDQINDTGDIFPPLIRGTERFEEVLGNQSLDPNWNNVMTYTKAPTQILTDGQMRRAHYYLTQHRSHQLMKATPDYNLSKYLKDAEVNWYQLLVNKALCNNTRRKPQITGYILR